MIICTVQIVQIFTHGTDAEWLVMPAEFPAIAVIECHIAVIECLIHLGPRESMVMVMNGDLMVDLDEW